MKSNRIQGVAEISRIVRHWIQFEPDIGFDPNNKPLQVFTFSVIAFLPIVIECAGWLIFGYYWDEKSRVLFILPFVLLYFLAGRKNYHQLGLRLTPVQGWRHWFKITMVLAGIMGSIIILFFTALSLMNFDLGLNYLALPPYLFWSRFLSMCIYAVIIEEMIYRFLFCLPLVKVMGKWWVIILNGLIFALIHVLYGNPGIDNFLAGFILSWAFLKSETILVPVFLHFAGNLAVVFIHIVIYMLR